MDLAVVHELVGRIAGVDVAVADRAVLTAGIGDVRRLISWARAAEVRFVAALAKVSSFPEKDVADAARTNLADGTRAMERADTARAMPELATALADGDVAAEHVDAAGRVRRRLDPALRPGLDAKSARLAEQAKLVTVDEFARILAREARQLEADAGIDRLQRQRQANSLKVGVNPVTGMFEMRGQFDPLTGASIAARLTEALNARMAQPTPADCPKYPFAKMDWLRTMALLDIATGAGRVGRRRSLWSSMPLPRLRLATVASRWWIGGSRWRSRPASCAICAPTLTPTSPLSSSVAGSPPRPWPIGSRRTTRVANRAQRRALRALYPTCGVPGCVTHFNLCVIHHIIWWRHGGLTDLANLIPLCVHHHHAVHDRGWHIHLAADRTLTITLPDGRIMTTGPPRTTAA